MKLSTHFASHLRSSLIGSVISLTASASADAFTWTGPSEGLWSDSNNWSGGVAPGGDHVAIFTSPVGPITIRLGANQAVKGLSTPPTSLTNVHSIVGQGGDRILTIGSEGINHTRGGLFIGSVTSGQKVDIVLADKQVWSSNRAEGSGSAEPITIHNNVTLAPDLGARTLTLDGLNVNSTIHGIIGNASGSTLNIVKDGSGTWTLNGANTYSGTTHVNAGTLRLGEIGGINPSKITVANGATLSLKVEGTNGGIGLTVDEIATMRGGVNLGASSWFGLDTSGGSATYGGSALSGIGFAKTGGNRLELTGTHSPTSTIVREGSLVLAAANTLSGPITVTNSSFLIARAGSGFTEAQITALRNSLVVDGNAHFGISTANGDYSFGGVMASSPVGVLRFSKADNGTLFLTGQNTYTGGTHIAGGTLSVSELKNGDIPSQMGASPAVPNGIILAGGRLQYTGSGHSTNRLFNLTSTSYLEASGTGALVFTNTDAMSAENGARSLVLTGYNRDDNEIRVSLRNITPDNNTTSIVKIGYGKWILSGSNTFSGGTFVRGGTLVLDYSKGGTPIADTSQITVQAGVAHFKGSGTKNIGTLNFAAADNGFATTKISGGMNLHAATLSTGGFTQRMVLIDLSGEGNSLTYANIGDGLRNTDSGNLLMATHTNRSNIVVRANDGSHGFAAAIGGNVGKLSGHTSFTGGAPGSPTSLAITSNITNYLLTAGSYRTTQSLDYQTITLDSTGGAINVEMASGHTFNSTGNGRGILFTGSNNINFTGAGGAITASTWFHNYLDDSAQLNIGNAFGTGGFLMVGGTGFTNFTGSSLAASEFVLSGGLFRMGTDQVLPTAGIYRINDAVFEIGAKLTAAGNTNDLERSSAQFRLIGDSGFSAYRAGVAEGAHGADRKVTLGTNLTWGESNFLINTSNGDGDQALRLSSSRSNATLDFMSNINLNGKLRTVDVAKGTAHGTANADARLSGNLTGTGIGSRLVKTGLGTLELTGINSYAGSTRVDEGKLRVGGGGLTATTSIHVRNSTLELAAANVINDAADLTLENATFITGGATETLGRLTLIGDNTLDLVGLGNIIRLTESAGIAWSSSLSIYNWNGNAGGGGPDQFFIGSNSNGVTGSQLSKIFFVDPTVNGTTYTGTFGSGILGTGEIVAVIPEPSAAALGLLASIGLIARRRRR